MGGKGVGGGCHGDSNTPVALPTCLPGPNLPGEGGEEGAEGGEAEGAEMVREGGVGEGEETSGEARQGANKSSAATVAHLCSVQLTCRSKLAAPHLKARSMQLGCAITGLHKEDLPLA